MCLYKRNSLHATTPSLCKFTLCSCNHYPKKIGFKKASFSLICQKQVKYNFCLTQRFDLIIVYYCIANYQIFTSYSQYFGNIIFCRTLAILPHTALYVYALNIYFFCRSQDYPHVQNILQMPNDNKINKFSVMLKTGRQTELITCIFLQFQLYHIANVTKDIKYFISTFENKGSVCNYTNITHTYSYSTLFICELKHSDCNKRI